MWSAPLLWKPSPWRDDDRWLLETLRSDPRILGFVGDLDPLHADFAADLGCLGARAAVPRLALRQPGSRDLLQDQTRPVLSTVSAKLAACGRGLDSANPNPHLIKGLLPQRYAAELRIIVDHLPMLGTGR